MKNLKILLVSFLLIFCYQNIVAQGVKIYKKNNAVIDIPYTQLDSIVAYGYEDSNNVVGKWIDLGLPSGTLWASCNVGASSPEEFGDYFAWGETSMKEEYTVENSLTNKSSMGDISGNPQYDVASAIWKNTARMPTLAECKELVELCSSVWTSHNGVNGLLVTGPNGNTIFLPAAGCRYEAIFDGVNEYGQYWSSTPIETEGYDAYFLDFWDKDEFNWDWDDRCYGFSIRPVRN